MAATICVINKKGGSGKSTTCFHLSGAFEAEGMRVLLIDADPQGSLIQCFLGPSEWEKLPAERTLTALLDENSFFSDFNSLIYDTGIQGIALCPANQTLDNYNTASPEKTGLDQYLLREFVQSQRENYDVILIDCPPNLYRCSWMAMIASDYVVIPVPPEDLGIQGIPAIHQAINNVRVLNPTLRRIGHFVNYRDGRLALHRHYEQRLREHYSELMLITVIPKAVAYLYAISCRKPVEYYDGKSVAARLTRDLSVEILDRIGMSRNEQEVTNG